MANHNPIVKVYTLQERNRLLTKEWSTLFDTTSKEEITSYKESHKKLGHSDIHQLKVVTRLFRKSDVEKLPYLIENEKA